MNINGRVLSYSPGRIRYAFVMANSATLFDTAGYVIAKSTLSYSMVPQTSHFAFPSQKVPGFILISGKIGAASLGIITDSRSFGDRK